MYLDLADQEVRHQVMLLGKTALNLNLWGKQDLSKHRMAYGLPDDPRTNGSGLANDQGLEILVLALVLLTVEIQLRPAAHLSYCLSG